MFVQEGEHRLFTREQKHIDKGFLHTHTPYSTTRLLKNISCTTAEHLKNISLKNEHMGIEVILAKFPGWIKCYSAFFTDK